MVKIAIQIATSMKLEGFAISEIIAELKRQGLPSGPVVMAIARSCSLEVSEAKNLVYDSPEYGSEKDTVKYLEETFLGPDLSINIPLSGSSHELDENKREI